MAAIRHLKFVTSGVYILWPLLPCCYTSLCKISLKSDSWLLSMVKKWFSIWLPSAILNFKNFDIWSHDCHRVPNVLLRTKFHQNWMSFRCHGNLTIFKMADVHHLEFLMFNRDHSSMPGFMNSRFSSYSCINCRKRFINI